MAATDRVTITLPADIVDAIQRAIDNGDYGSSDDVVREALSDWHANWAQQPQAVAELKADIARGLADLAAGRVRDFDAQRIIERGRQR